MYRIICPKNNWKNPITVDQKGLDTIREIATRLRLQTTYDKQQLKLYVDLPSPEEPLSFKIAQAIGPEVQLAGEVVIFDILQATQDWPRPHVAYVIATAWHESRLGKYMVELSTGTQYEGRKDLGNVKPGDGARYKGRGYVQITGRVNYKKFGSLLKRPLNLELYPEMATKPKVALEILLLGMKKGLFTGVGLDDYTTEVDGTYVGDEQFVGFDFLNARRIVNGLDKAEHIADIARRILNVFKEVNQERE